MLKCARHPRSQKKSTKSWIHFRAKDFRAYTWCLKKGLHLTFEVLLSSCSILREFHRWIFQSRSFRSRWLINHALPGAIDGSKFCHAPSKQSLVRCNSIFAIHREIEEWTGGSSVEKRWRNARRPWEMKIVSQTWVEISYSPTLAIEDECPRNTPA